MNSTSYITQLQFSNSDRFYNLHCQILKLYTFQNLSQNFLATLNSLDMAAHKLFIDYAIDRKDAFEQTQKVLDMLERTNKLLKKQDEDKIAMDLKFELTRKELQILKEKASSQEKEALKLKEIVQSQEKKVQSQEKELQILKEQVQKLQENWLDVE